jgi:signal transduction histidine kinase
MLAVRETDRPHAGSSASRVGAWLPTLLLAERFGYVFGVAAVVLVTVVLEVLLSSTRLGNASTIYALVVLVTAALYGRWPALATAVAAFFAFEHRQGTLANPPEWLTPIIFAVTALVAGQLAAMLRQQAQAARQSQRETLALFEVAQLVPGSTLELQPLLGLILDRLKSIVEYKTAEIILFAEHDEAVVFAYSGPLPNQDVVGRHLPTASGLSELVQEVRRRREPVFVDDLGGRSLLAKDLVAAGVAVPAATLHEHSELAVPLIVKGRVIGVQTLIQSAPGYYRARHADLAMTFGQQAAVAIENARLYGEVSTRLSEMVGLQQLGATLLQEHDFDRLLHAICLQLQTLTDAEGAAIGLLEEDPRYFELRTVLGPGADNVQGTLIPVEGSFSGEAMRTNQPQRSNDAQNDPRGLLLRDAHSILSVPMRTRQQVVGAISMYNKRNAVGFTDHDAELATLFAQQAAVAVENARLYEEVRGKAALEERQRLARELHDSVSQALFGIALNASTADELFEVQPEQARGLLTDVLGLAEAALAELQALIFELRPESLEREGLVGALEKQAAAARARHGLQVRLEASSEPDLPQPAKEALYRVAQEALHNAAKHARAREVMVMLEVGASAVGLLVADDGRGFDPRRDFPGHLGLQSMRERAVAVGGTLEIESAPGNGTRVRASIPVRAQA